MLSSNINVWVCISIKPINLILIVANSDSQWKITVLRIGKVHLNITFLLQKWLLSTPTCILGLRESKITPCPQILRATLCQWVMQHMMTISIIFATETLLFDGSIVAFVFQVKKFWVIWKLVFNFNWTRLFE